MTARRVMLLLLLLLLPPAKARAHPISMTGADVFVTRERVDVAMHVMAEDLWMFHGLAPDDENRISRAQLEEAAEKHKAFLLKYFTLLDVAGERLTGRVVRVEKPELEPAGLNVADLMAYTLVYHLEYPLAAPPEFLTISNDFGGEESFLPAVMELRVKQEGYPAQYPVEIGRGQPQIVRFEWKLPPLSPTASRAEQEKWQAELREQTLGITNYSGIYSFLYITDQEVRHEILLPLLTLETWFPVPRREKYQLEVDEQEAARQQIAEFFGKGNPVEIDGRIVKPTVQRIDFFGLELKDFAQRAAPRRVNVANARVGVILTYPAQRSPRQVKFTWERFNWQVWELRSTVFALDTTEQHVFYPARPTFTWTRSAETRPVALETVPPPPPARKLGLPLGSIFGLGLIPLAVIGLRRRGRSWQVAVVVALVLFVLAALAWPLQAEVRDPFRRPMRLSPKQARVVFASLQRNIYRAFEHRSESEVYDTLARSVDGPLLSELYLQIHQGLEMQEQGGAVARVGRVEIVAGEVEATPVNVDPRAFTYRCTWNVEGTVEHWGHIHARTNQYQARFVVSPWNETWRITAMDVLGQRRIKFQTTLRESG